MGMQAVCRADAGQANSKGFGGLPDRHVADFSGFHLSHSHGSALRFCAGLFVVEDRWREEAVPILALASQRPNLALVTSSSFHIAEWVL